MTLKEASDVIENFFLPLCTWEHKFQRILVQSTPIDEEQPSQVMTAF